MLYGRPVILACPGCAGAVRRNRLISGNSFGARYWTDGKCEAPMLPVGEALVKCPHCAALFWIDRAMELGHAIDPGDFEGWPESALYERPSVSDYLGFLEAETLSEEDERYLRIRVWWGQNDALRGEPEDGGGACDPAEFESNLAALFAMMGGEEPGERLLKAEAARELGRFEQCRTLLEFDFPSDHDPYVKAIETLCHARKRSVAELG